MPSKPCTDHLGNKFDSQKEMCEHWNISQGTFRRRQQHSWSLEELLCGKNITDHLGNKFDSITDMCQYWDIDRTTFQSRQKLGWSLEKSLCNKKTISPKLCTDHLGNKFDSQRKMCQHWNVEQTTFRNRQRHNWSLEESLCGRQLNKRKKPCIDHLGNKFDSQRKMCQHWNINAETFRDRQNRGWSLLESLGIIPRLKVKNRTSKASFQNYQLTPNITIIDNVPDTDCYFICLINNEDKTIYHRNELINEYIKYNKE